jgi:translation initiation factor eIF-2B subunit delta
MLPPSVEESIQGIAEDHTSGASRVARLALETMTLLAVEAKGRPKPEDLAEAARRISEAQPVMAVVYNVVHVFARLVQEGHDPMKTREELASEMDMARERIAGSYLKVIADNASLVTASFSDNVLACLQAAHARGRLAHVTALESRPLLEGRFMVIALTEAGIPASLAPDGLGPGIVANSSGVLLGADTVLKDGSVVNKIGSYGLALAAQAHGKPVHVVCETLKFDARHDAASWPGSPPMNPREVWENPPEKVDVLNRYFEVVPAELVTLVVTERGSYPPDILRTMMTTPATAEGSSSTGL